MGGIHFQRCHCRVFAGDEESSMSLWRRKRTPAPSPRTLRLSRSSPRLPRPPRLPGPSGGLGRGRPGEPVSPAPWPAAAACGPGGPHALRTEAGPSPSPRPTEVSVPGPRPWVRRGSRDSRTPRLRRVVSPSLARSWGSRRLGASSSHGAASPDASPWGLRCGQSRVPAVGLATESSTGVLEKGSREREAGGTVRTERGRLMGGGT